TLGVHSYLSYLRDRLILCRELLTDSGSIFVQISDENLHRVRCVMDEVFGAENFCGMIPFRRGGFQTTELLPATFDFLLWYARDRTQVKYRSLFELRDRREAFPGQDLWAELPSGECRRIQREDITEDTRIFRHKALYSAS